jgi:hypothetical protein
LLSMRAGSAFPLMPASLKKECAYAGGRWIFV